MKARQHKYWKRDPEWDQMQRLKQEWLPITAREYYTLGLMNFVRRYRTTLIAILIGGVLWGATMMVTRFG